MEDLLQVGVITETHGIKGEVKVFPTTDDPERFSDLDEVLLDLGREKKLLHVAGVKYFKQYVIVRFKEFNNINQIEPYVKKTLWVTRENAVPLEEDEYFIADLIGLEVVSDEGEKLGVISDVIRTGANDVYEVKQENGKEILLPAIKDCILDVDLEGAKMTVHVLMGLFDL